MMLSVISLFARQGSDPWREANRLAELPRAAAADSLAQAIADLPPGQWTLPDAAAIAARLIGLLPARPARVERPSAANVVAWPPSTRSTVILAGIAFGVVCAAAVMLRPASARFDGRDVASFVTQAPGDVPQSAAPGSR